MTHLLRLIRNAQQHPHDVREALGLDPDRTVAPYSVHGGVQVALLLVLKLQLPA